ncbi:MAG: glycosyltransferase family 4 protein [Acidobacteriota bacterium]
MRILQISSARDYGGGERHVIDLARGLMLRGHEVFAALRPTNTWQNRLDFLPAENILHVSIRNSFGILSSRRIADFVRDHEIDIVHAHVARDYIPASLACSLAKRAKFVLTRHVLFELKSFNRFALKNLTRAIAVSSGVGAGLRKIFPQEKIVVIPHGIEMIERSVEERAALGQSFRTFHEIPDDVPLIGILGELIELKGQREFVMAANEIAKNFPTARFVVVGKDHSIEKKFRRELKRLAGVFEMENRFVWLDWLDDTAPFYAALDVFVSASHTESFGLAILEAMAGGTAVIATETIGAREVIANEEFLVPIKDPVVLAATVSKFLSAADARSEAARFLAARAAANFSANRMIDATEQLYLEVLGPR